MTVSEVISDAVAGIVENFWALAGSGLAMGVTIWGVVAAVQFLKQTAK